MAAPKPARKQPPAGPPARPNRPKGRPRRWYEGPLPVVGTVVVLGVIVAALLLYSQSGGKPAPTPAPSAANDVVTGITGLDPTASLAVGSGGLKSPLKATGAHGAAPDGAKLQVTYVGAEYCPYCAAERWSLMVALSRFGTFSGVQLTQSSSTDIYPNTPTFTFTKATFEGSSVAFTAVETEDRDQRPLQPLTGAPQAALAKYDAAGSIPFVDLGDAYYAVGAGFLPDRMQGLTWHQILDQVRSYDSPLAQQVIGNANWLTAGICRAGATADACSDSHIQALEAQLAS